jgi:hypothetical protein
MPRKPKKCPECKQPCRELDQGADGTLYLCANEQCKMYDEVVGESMP